MRACGRYSRTRATTFLLGTVSILAISPAAFAADAVWNGLTNGDISNTSNWTPAGPPDGIATLGNTAGATALTLNGTNATIGALDVTAIAPVYTVSIGNGTLTLNGAGVTNASATPLTFTVGNLGNLTMENSATLGNSNVVLATGANGAFLRFGAGTYTLSGSVSGTGRIVSDATNMLVTAAQSGLVITQVDSGTWRAGATNVFSSEGGFGVATGATIDLDSLNQQISFFNGTGNIALGSATLTFGNTINNTTAFEGDVSGSGNLVKIGTSQAAFNAVSTYTGTTTVNGGVMGVGPGGNLSGTSALIVNSGASFRIFDGGTLNPAAAINLSTGGDLTINRATALTFANVISGDGSLIKSGTGVVTLTGGNLHTGATSVNAGTLRAGAANAFSSASAHSIASGATLSLNDFNNAIASLAGSGNVTLGTATLTTGAGGIATVFGGVISGTGGLTKVGGSSFTLTGTNLHAGVTTISAGTLSLGDGGTTGSVGGAIVNNAGLIVNRSNAISLASPISGSGTLNKLGAGTLTLFAASYAGDTDVDVGTLQAGSANALSSASAHRVAAGAALALNDFNNVIGSLAGSGGVSLGSGTLALGGNNLSTTFSGSVSGTGGLTKTGTGMLTLTGANIYTGVTTISAGVLSLGDGGTSGNVAGAVVNNASLVVNRSNATSLSALSGSGTLTKLGAGVLTLSSASHSGATTISGGTLLAGSSAALSASSAHTVSSGATLALNNFNSSIGSLAGAGNVTLGSATLSTGGNNTSTTFAGNVSGTGGLTKVGSGTLTFSGGSYTGGTTVASGTLQAGSASGLAAASSYTLASGAALALNNFNNAIGSLSGAGNVSLGSATLILGGDNSSTTMSGGISGSGGLSKVGTGIFNLTGTSTYSGTTSVSAGILAVNGSVSNSSIGVTGGTLRGAGTVGAVVAGSGGTVAPGNSIGTLNIAGNVTFGAGSTYQVEVDTAGASDRISAGGTATLSGGTVDVQAAPGLYQPITDFTILTASGGVTGAFSSVTSNFAFFIPSLSYGANSVTLRLTRNDLDFASVALTPNQKASASAIQAGGFGSTLYNALISKSPDDARTAFDATSGEIHGTLLVGLFEDGLVLRRTILERLRSDALPQSGSVALWTRASQNWTELKDDGNAARAGYSLTQVSFGADAEIAEGWYLGALAGFASGELDSNARQSKGTRSSGHFGIYAAGSLDLISFRTGAALSWGSARNSRGVTFPGFSDLALSEQDVGSRQIFAEAGYVLAQTQFRIEPFLGLAWSEVNAGGLSETGGSAALSGQGEAHSALFTTLGVGASSDFLLGTIPAVLKMRAAWQHAITGNSVDRTMAFIATGMPLTIFGNTLDSDRALIDVGFDFDVAGARLGVGYQGSIGHQAVGHGLSADLKVSF